MLACAALLPAALVSAAEPVISPSKLKQLSLDELVDIEVTSVSRNPEQLETSAAAVTVVTNEHLMRSGATTIPEALRWVPGLHVARRNANSWGVSSRGFSSTNSEKLLVLSDTRSIYTPLFSGVSWDVQDYLLADIDRIEVIRGPGASLWGSNAVNGVINITTLPAAATQGHRLETTIGTEERARVAARYGGRTENGVWYRVFGTYSYRDESYAQADSSDDWHLGHAGFRADWSASGESEFTLQGDAYSGEVGQLAPAVQVLGRPGPTGELDAGVMGANLLGRWRRALGVGSEIQLRAYYDWTHRDDPSFEDDLETFDLDLQHRITAAERHQLTWGVNYRRMANTNVGAGIFALDPPSSDDQLVSAFIQDHIAITDALHVTLGTKWEHNDFSGTEWQPSVRAAWSPAERHALWAAVSRAARIPTRLERDVAIDASDPAGDPVLRLLGNRAFEAEELVAYELGYRWRVSGALHLDLAFFENRYDDLASLEPGEPFADPRDGRTIVPIVARNLTRGRSRGAEALVTFAPTPEWRLSASYSHFRLRLEPSGLDLNRGEFYEGATPRHHLALSSYLSLPYGIQFDAHLRAVSRVERMPDDPAGAGIPSYEELDLRLAWQASARFQVSIVGQNVLHARHIEGGGPDARGAIERGVYAQFTWGL